MSAGGTKHSKARGLKQITDHDRHKAVDAHFLRNTYHATAYQLTYVATPKVACTTFKWWIASLLGIAQDVERYADSSESSPDLVIHDALPAIAAKSLPQDINSLLATLKAPGHFSFAVVRNPYTRVFSAWQSKILLREPLQITPYLDKSFFHATIESAGGLAGAFEQFLEHLQAFEAPHYWDVHWTPQCELLRPNLIPYTKIAHLESIAELYQALVEHLGPSVPLPSSGRRINESLLPFSRNLLSDRSIEIIRHLYADDFECFEYPLEPPQGHGDLTPERLTTALQGVQMLRARHARMAQTHRERDIGRREEERLRQDLAACEQDLAACEQAIAALYASRSWRAVAPARAATRNLRRLRDFVRNKTFVRLPVPRRSLSQPNTVGTPQQVVTLEGDATGHTQETGTILIVADLLPLFDQASGGLRLKSLIDMMGEAGWPMVFGSFSGLDTQPGVLSTPEGRARYEDALRRAGVTQIIYGASEIDHYIASTGQKLQWVFLSFPNIAFRFLPIVRRHCPETRVIYDMVDFHSIRLAREAELHHDPNIRQQAEEMRSIEIACAAAADITIAITEEEKTALLAIVPEAIIKVIPNVFEVPPCVPQDPSGRDGLFFVGGFWHKPNSDAVRWFAQDIFPRLREAIPDLVFRIAGANAGDEVLALAQQPGIEVLGFVEDLESLYQRHRVFVAPLRYGAGMKGKVGQSLANGLPVVTTPVGAEGMGLQNDTHLLVADGKEAFVAQVLRVLDDDQLWMRLSVAGREHIRDHYSTAAVRDHLGALLGG